MYTLDTNAVIYYLSGEEAIAASALYTGTTLVTRNTKDFARVREVRIAMI